MKKLLTLVLAIAMLASCMVFPAMAEELPTVTMIMGGDNNPPEDNDVIKAIREKTGVNLQVTYISTGDMKTKLNTMIASNTEPDIFSIDGQELIDLKAAGRIINMEPYLAEYGPDILADVNFEDQKKNVVNNDGIYALMGFNGQYHKSLTVRTDWLKAVGKEVPTTIDELYDVLYAFTYNDPDGNGQNDTWGMAMSMASANFWTNIFGGGFDIPMSGFDSVVELEDGTVTTVMKHPNFLAAMTFMNKLYHDGLFDPDFVNLTNMQAFEQLWNSKVGMLGWESVGPTNNWYPGRYTWDVPADPAEQFDYIWLNGKGAYKMFPSFTAGNVISANCKNPEAAIKVLNYMWFTEEGQTLTYLGIEGKHFEWVDKEQGKYQRLGIYTDDTTHRAAGAFVYGYGKTAQNGETRVMNKLTQDNLVKAADIAVARPYFTAILETRTEYGADLDALVKECFANMIVADPAGLEAMLADYIARWEDEGGLDYEEEATALWAATK